MNFTEKDCGGIELHLDKTERELLLKAVLKYITNGKGNEQLPDEMSILCKVIEALCRLAK